MQSLANSLTRYGFSKETGLGSGASLRRRDQEQRLARCQPNGCARRAQRGLGTDGHVVHAAPLGDEGRTRSGHGGLRVCQVVGKPQGHRGTTTTWDKTVIDRQADLKTWVVVLRRLVEDKRIRKIFAFANNDYTGHAPATVKQFWELWNTK